MRRMPKRKPKKSIIVVLNVVAVFLALSAASANRVFASRGSIAMSNSYPDDGGTYEFVDRFLEQTTAINTNTTVSVSIDGGSLVPMTFEGVRKEVVPGDSVARNWYT